MLSANSSSPRIRTARNDPPMGRPGRSHPHASAPEHDVVGRRKEEGGYDRFTQVSHVAQFHLRRDFPRDQDGEIMVPILFLVLVLVLVTEESDERRPLGEF